MKPVFCGSFDYETRQTDLDRLFSKFGKVDRVDMKTGFAFVYFDNEQDADDAIKHLDNTPFGSTKRRLTVEWSRGERGSRNREGTKPASNQRPTKTLFVINFDPNSTGIADIEKHFEPYGKVLHVRIRRNFAFVQFDSQEDATKALEATHMSEISGRVVSVEYALKDDGERSGDRRGSPRRVYGSRDSPYGRSRSPVHRRNRPSPDYGRGPSPDPYYGRARSPAYVRPRSPVYGGRPRSPVYGARPRSPIYGARPRSPVYGARPRSPTYGRADPAYGRARSPGYERYNVPAAFNRKSSPGYDRYRSGSPLRR